MIIFDMFFFPEAHDDPVDWSTALCAGIERSRFASAGGGPLVPAEAAN